MQLELAFHSLNQLQESYVLNVSRRSPASCFVGTKLPSKVHATGELLRFVNTNLLGWLHKIVCLGRPQGNKPMVMLDDSGFLKDESFQGNLLSILREFADQFLVSSSNFNPGCVWVPDFPAIQFLAPKLRMILRKSLRCLGDLVLIQFSNSKL